MIRTALVGVGNCASALVQGIEFYKNGNARAPGLMTPDIGGYEPGDIQVVAGFDVNETKVGLDLSSAIFAEPNNTRIFCEVPYKDVTVVAGPKLDGVGPTAGRVVHAVSAEEDVAAHLVATKTEVVVNFLPVGSKEATSKYATAALAAGCAFVNAIPMPVARDPEMQAAFTSARLPLIGDDVKSQLGATYVHRALTTAFSRRGIRLNKTYQLNVGGNMDFYNMLDGDRLVEKRISKTDSIMSVANDGEGMADDDVHISPTTHVPWLGDQKVALIRMEGSAFGGAPLEIDVKMTVWDSPNSAGIVMDAIRYARRALDAGVGGVLEVESAWLMKAPHTQMPDDEAYARLGDHDKSKSARIAR